MPTTSSPGSHSGIARRLIDRGLIEPAACERALHAARDAEQTLLEFLVRQGRVDPRQAGEAAAHEYGLPFLDLQHVVWDRLPIIEPIAEKLISRFQVLPLARDDRRLTVAIAFPATLARLDELQFTTGLAIDGVLVPFDQLERALARRLQHQDTSGMLEALDEASDAVTLDTSEIDLEEEAAALDAGGDNDAPIVRFVNRVLRDAIQRGASDVHFEPYESSFRARYTDDTGLLATTASRWQQYAPDDSAPEELLSGIAIDRGDWPGALRHRLELARDGQPARLLELVELAIEAHTPLSPLRDQLQAFLATHPTQLDAQLAMARLEAASGEADVAQQRLARLTRTHAAEPLLWLTRAQIAIESGDNAQAAALARRGQALAPDDARFVLALAQAEIAAGDLDAAEIQVNQLLAAHDNTPSLRLGLAQLYLEAGALDPAKRLLLPLLDRDATPPAAYLLLGTIAESQDEPDNALLYYRQVPPGPGFAESRALAVQMLVAAGRLDDAENFLRIESLRHPRQRALLTQIGVQALDAVDDSARADALLADSLARDPDNSDLLYSRAMRDYAQGDVDAMIATLRDIIAREPDNAAALNALGYTLATDSDRYDEAFGLIDRKSTRLNSSHMSESRMPSSA